MQDAAVRFPILTRFHPNSDFSISAKFTIVVAVAAPRLSSGGADCVGVTIGA